MPASPSPAPSLIRQTTEDLKRHAPFDAMDAAHLADVARNLELRYVSAGETVLEAGAGSGAPAEFLFIVQRGEIAGTAATEAGGGERLVLGEGECFPLGALIARRPSVLRFVAITDSFVYRLPLAAFEHAMDVSRPLRDFATRRIAALLEQSQRRVQAHYAARFAGGDALSRPLGALVARAPRTVAPDTALREVLGLMKGERIGSVIVVSESGAPVGIFTERDVLDRVALAACPLDTAVSEVMTRDPVCLPAHAAAFEAAQAMARLRVRHVPVMDAGRLVGIVSERDLFALQRLTAGEVAKSIEQANDASQLARAAAKVRELAFAMLAQGVLAQPLTHLITILNDAIVGRALTLSGFAAHGADWCWLGLGSEGRMEQTLSTDQDNALIFLPAQADGADAAERLAGERERWIALAGRANALLDACGFPLCKGGVMASNPRWCLTPSEWRHQFGAWLAGADGEALLNAAIFFDLRPLAGNAALAAALRGWLRDHVPKASLFLRQLARSALEVRPPLGLVRDFVLDGKDVPGTLDLKQLGARPFIDAARVQALRHGVAATNTAERIAQCAPALRMGGEESGAIADAFHFVQTQRLRSQEPGAEGAPLRVPNRLYPATLNDLDRRILKESFRQARKWQSRLELDFLT